MLTHFYRTLLHLGLPAGGMNITISDFDPSVQLSNPALLDLDHRHISVSQIIQPGGINFQQRSYVHDFKSTVHGALACNMLRMAALKLLMKLPI